MYLMLACSSGDETPSDSGDALIELAENPMEWSISLGYAVGDPDSGSSSTSTSDLVTSLTNVSAAPLQVSAGSPRGDTGVGPLLSVDSAYDAPHGPGEKAQTRLLVYMERNGSARPEPGLYEMTAEYLVGTCAESAEEYTTYGVCTPPVEMASILWPVELTLTE